MMNDSIPPARGPAAGASIEAPDCLRPYRAGLFLSQCPRAVLVQRGQDNNGCILMVMCLYSNSPGTIRSPVPDCTNVAAAN